MIQKIQSLVLLVCQGKAWVLLPGSLHCHLYDEGIGWEVREQKLRPLRGYIVPLLHPLGGEYPSGWSVLDSLGWLQNGQLLWSVPRHARCQAAGAVCPGPPPVGCGGVQPSCLTGPGTGDSLGTRRESKTLCIQEQGRELLRFWWYRQSWAKRFFLPVLKFGAPTQ